MTTQWMDRPALLAGELSARDIAAMVATGELQRIRRGRYVRGNIWSSADEQQRHRVRAGELGRSTMPRAAVSHESAALLHGLELPGGAMPRVHLTWPGSPGRRTTTNIIPHRGRLDPQDLVEVDGALVTTAARTVFDVARLGVWRRAIAVADSALRLTACTAEELADVIERHRQIPGAFRARRLIEFADPLAESVGESICRLVMAQLGLPAPVLQSTIIGLDRTTRYRVDFDFVELGTVAEFDGRVKYGRLLTADQTPGDAVFAEKVREDRIRDTGRQCVRVVWSDLQAPRALLPRFSAAFRRAGAHDWRPASPRFLDRPARQRPA